ncbi:ankyrin repeat domain-containing protein [Dactylosporangium sp. CA-092794]|uniref:ankyrin repeat domain-containing protein n=1 Tax=Dactylosporangium sp. CA-092794 TaxID=3239929 RepID=UPI003D8E7204
MTSALVSRSELGVWRRVRRYDVPPAMIAAATAARLAGDWRAACTAAGIEVRGPAEDFAEFADDLAHLAPDLVRWHLPRSPARGDTTPEPRQLIVLARRGDRMLAVATPRVGLAVSRMALFAGEGPADEEYFHGEYDWSASRERWDAREAGELIRRTCGPRAAEVLALQDAGRIDEAWATAGVDVPMPPTGERFPESTLRPNAAALDADPDRLLAAARATGRTEASIPLGYYYYELRLRDLDTDRPRGEWLRTDRRAEPGVAIGALLRPVDLHLVRLGLLSPADLHPLIGPLLEPFAAPVPPRRPDADPAPVRVRCGGRWHEVGWAAGRLHIPHDDEERRREDALRALGGELHGCFAAAAGWRDRSVPLPRRLEAQRTDLMMRAVHGDLAGVVALLDAGVDPHARDPHGRTLLHLLPCFAHDPGGALALLDRLLAAGLDLEDRDRRGRTPLHTAVHGDGSPDLVRALLAAGALVTAEDNVFDSIADAYTRHRRDDLPFLDELLPG